MKVCRFKSKDERLRIGVVVDSSMVLDLSASEIVTLSQLLEGEVALQRLREISGDKNLPRLNLSEVQLCPPIEQHEVWAAGVTYLRSKKARMEESNFSATAYDRVYEAARPELFFKSLPEKVAGPNDPVGIRKDSRWSVPEPELALVINSKGSIAGYTIGNDMSSRDIEGENLLYLPQAKIYQHSCALGPWIEIGSSEEQAREWTIGISITRGGKVTFKGETSIGQIKRDFADLAEYLFRSQSFPHGAVLLTGTGVVPPDHFTLQPKDEIEITISGIGTLRNTVIGI